MTRFTFERSAATRATVFRVELDRVASTSPVGSVTVRVGRGPARSMSLGEAPAFVEAVPPLVDPAATRAARDLAVRLDELRDAKLMIAGQQLPLWRKDWDEPLVALGEAASAISVLGFAVDELDERRDHAGQLEVLSKLSSWAEAGKILDVSWYPSNPATGGNQEDRRRLPSMKELVDEPTSKHGRHFWGEFERKALPSLSAFAEHGVAVLFRPLLEGNGSWFWWGCGGRTTADTTTCERDYHALYAEIERRVAQAGVHNIVWQYSFSPNGGARASDAVALLPRDSLGRPLADVAGMSTYDDKVDGISEITGLETLKAVSAVLSRVALGEVGGAHVKDGRWDPQAITDALERANESPDTAVFPLFARFWFDDEFEPFETLSNPSYKQLSSLKFADGAAGAGKAWLRGFDHGVMRTSHREAAK